MHAVNGGPVGVVETVCVGIITTSSGERLPGAICERSCHLESPPGGIPDSVQRPTPSLIAVRVAPVLLEIVEILNLGPCEIPLIGIIVTVGRIGERSKRTERFGESTPERCAHSLILRGSVGGIAADAPVERVGPCGGIAWQTVGGKRSGGLKI